MRSVAGSEADIEASQHARHRHPTCPSTLRDVVPSSNSVAARPTTAEPSGPPATGAAFEYCRATISAALHKQRRAGHSIHRSGRNRKRSGLAARSSRVLAEPGLGGMIARLAHVRDCASAQLEWAFLK